MLGALITAIFVSAVFLLIASMRSPASVSTKNAGRVDGIITDMSPQAAFKLVIQFAGCRIQSCIN